MKEITHRLVDVASEKLLNITLKGNNLITESGKAGKLKTTEKEFGGAEEALKNFFKKEWESLKKGFVLNNDAAQAGEPILHKFIGGGYTGCLSFQETSSGIFVYKNIGQDQKLIDQLVLIDQSGNVLKEIALPEALAWRIEYRHATNSLLLDIDHYIYEYDIQNDTFKNLGNAKRDHTSFLSLGDDRTAFGTNGEISVINNRNEVVSSLPYEFETIKGSTPFCGRISTDGKILAFHNKVGEVQIIDATSGTVLSKVVGGFEMVEQMEFATDNKLLVIKEQYGSWGMKYIDLSTNKEVEIKELEIPEYTKSVDVFCFNEDQSTMVLVQGEKAHVFDFQAKKLLHSFKIQHVVKRCTAKFIENKLGVRTDYGCFSLYNI